MISSDSQSEFREDRPFPGTIEQLYQSSARGSLLTHVVVGLFLGLIFAAAENDEFEGTTQKTLNLIGSAITGGLIYGPIVALPTCFAASILVSPISFFNLAVVPSRVLCATTASTGALLFCLTAVVVYGFSHYPESQLFVYFFPILGVCVGMLIGYSFTTLRIDITTRTKPSLLHALPRIVGVAGLLAVVGAFVSMPLLAAIVFAEIALVFFTVLSVEWALKRTTNSTGK